MIRSAFPSPAGLERLNSVACAIESLRLQWRDRVGFSPTSLISPGRCQFSSGEYSTLEFTKVLPIKSMSAHCCEITSAARPDWPTSTTSSSGRAADARGRRSPVRCARSARRRLARQSRAREAPRRAHLLQLQPPARGDQRLRGELPVLLVRAAEAGRCRRLHDVARAGVGQAAAARAISRSPRSTSSTACIPICRSSYYTELLRGFKRIRPDIHLKCFTAVEIAFFADLYGMTDEQVLRELMDAGLDSLPGGGAEIFAERVRRKICHDKCGTDRYLEIHRIAHRLGHALERHDALRAHRDDGGARRSHAARARAAGRDRRLPGVHPAGVSSRQQPDAQAAGAERRPTRCACTRWRG